LTLHLGKSEKSTTRTGLGFLGLSLTAILFLTLMPVPEWQWQPEKRFSLCILCTAGTVPDFLENILLFLPLGVALAFRCHRLWPSILFGGLLSLAIEITQFVIPGRDPSLQDIVCNTFGTLIGFGIAHSFLEPSLARVLGRFRQIWEQCKRPNPTLAKVLACGALLITTGVFTLTGCLLQPAFPPGPYLFAGQELDGGATPLRIGANGDRSGFFKGLIDEVRIYDRALAPVEIQADMDRPVGAGSPASAPGLVAAYGFEEADGDPIVDLTGHGNDGLLDGAVRVAGRFGQALKFDGRGAQVIIPHAPILNLRSGFTLAAWIRPEPSASSWPAVIDKEGDLYFLYAGADRVLVPSGGGTFGGANEGVVASEVVAAGAWSYLAATYDGSTLRMYVNGRPVASFVRWFRGRVDEMSISNTPIRPGYFDTRWLMESLGKGKAIQLRGTGGPVTSERGALLDIRNRHPGDHLLWMAAYGEDLVIHHFTVAAALGLPSPEIRVRGALQGISSGSPLEIEIAGTWSERSLSVNGLLYRGLGFSLGRGWTIFMYSEPLPLWLHELLNLAWMAGWTFLIGFWSPTRLVLFGAIVIVAGTIWLLPFLEMFVLTPSIQLVAASIGLLVGIFIRMMMGFTVIQPCGNDQIMIIKT
jgi:hypothetical protein